MSESVEEPDNTIGTESTATRESYWVCFYPNPQYKETKEKSVESVNGDDESVEVGERRRQRKWLGTLSDRPSKKVITGNIFVDNFIESVFTERQKVPVEVPCFLTEKFTAFVAEAIDNRKYELSEEKRDIKTGKTDDFVPLKRRLTFLESQFVQLLNEVNRLRIINEVEDILIVFDYQNFEKTCKEHGVYIHPSSVVDLASKFMTVLPRRIVRAMIVDFKKVKHDAWKRHKHFSFVEVPPRKMDEVNPTDQIIYEATLAAIREEKMSGGVVCIVSGDHHFVPLLKQLKSLGFDTMLVAQYPRSITENVRDEPDYYINLLSPAKIESVSEVKV